jgi:hypothetical protein
VDSLASALNQASIPAIVERDSPLVLATRESCAARLHVVLAFTLWSFQASALGDEEQYAGLPLHYLFGAIPVGGNG